MSQTEVLSTNSIKSQSVSRQPSLRILASTTPSYGESSKHTQGPLSTTHKLRNESHVRSRSVATSPTKPTHPTRARASSMAYHNLPPSTSRARVYSFSNLGTGAIPKADAVTTPVTIDEDETIGSFTPTSSARRHLHSLLGTSPRPKYHSSGHSRSRTVSSFSTSTVFPKFPLSRTSSSDSISPPDSPIPSISRTPPCYDTASDYSFPTAPSSAGPLTPAHSSRASSLVRTRSPSLRTPKALADLEDKSMLCVRTTCATCRTPGSNYPCCPRCGEMWCSRACRLKANGGKKHVCRKSKKLVQ